VTYLDKAVQDLVNSDFVPVQVKFPDDVATRRRYDANWTPTLVFLDADGEALHRLVPASLPPDEFIPAVLAGLAHALSAEKRGGEAIAHLDRVVREFPRSLAAPEALYWRGVAQYHDGDEEAMAASWKQLASRFPDSYWGKAITFVKHA